MAIIRQRQEDREIFRQSKCRNRPNRLAPDPRRFRPCSEDARLSSYESKVTRERLKVIGLTKSEWHERLQVLAYKDDS